MPYVSRDEFNNIIGYSKWPNANNPEEIAEDSPELISYLSAKPITYKDSRKRAYPTMGDQLDMLWHSMDSGELPKSLAFYEAIKAVKDAYPKS